MRWLVYIMPTMLMSISLARMPGNWQKQVTPRSSYHTMGAMGGVDAIVFTAGLGENSPFMRDKICNGLEYLGTRIDPDLNKVRGKEREISVRRARVKIFVIPTNEESL